MVDTAKHCPACGREIVDDMLKRLVQTDRAAALKNSSKVEIDTMDRMFRRFFNKERLASWLTWQSAAILERARVLFREKFELNDTPVPEPAQPADAWTDATPPDLPKP